MKILLNFWENKIGNRILIGDYLLEKFLIYFFLCLVGIVCVPPCLLLFLPFWTIGYVGEKCHVKVPKE